MVGFVSPSRQIEAFCFNHVSLESMNIQTVRIVNFDKEYTISENNVFGNNHRLIDPAG